MIGSTVLMKIAQLRSYTISPGRPLRMPDGFCLVFVHIRIANQMLMLVSGSCEARQLQNGNQHEVGLQQKG